MAKRTRAEAEAQARELWKLRAQELEGINDKLTRALQVLMRTVHIRAYLNANDPKAVAQALAALGEAPAAAEAEAPAAVGSRGWQVLTPAQLARVNRRLAAVAAGGAPTTIPNRCDKCGTKTAHTEDWTLYPWPDGVWLCNPCNDARHEDEDYSEVEARVRDEAEPIETPDEATGWAKATPEQAREYQWGGERADAVAVQLVGSYEVESIEEADGTLWLRRL